MNLLINIKNLPSKTNILTYTEIIKQTVKKCKIINLFMNKILLHIYILIYTLGHIRVIIFSIHTYIYV